MRRSEKIYQINISWRRNLHVCYTAVDEYCLTWCPNSCDCSSFSKAYIVLYCADVRSWQMRRLFNCTQIRRPINRHQQYVHAFRACLSITPGKTIDIVYIRASWLTLVVAKHQISQVGLPPLFRCSACRFTDYCISIRKQSLLDKHTMETMYIIDNFGGRYVVECTKSSCVLERRRPVLPHSVSQWLRVPGISTARIVSFCADVPSGWVCRPIDRHEQYVYTFCVYPSLSNTR